MNNLKKMTRIQLIKEVEKLRKEIKDIEEARAIKVEIPDSWIIKE